MQHMVFQLLTCVTTAPVLPFNLGRLRPLSRNTLTCLVRGAGCCSLLRTDALRCPPPPSCQEHFPIMSRIRCLSVLGVLAIGACADVPVSPTAELSGRGLSLASAQGEKSYVLIASGALPADLNATVVAAGGSVTSRMDQIGVAVASSSDAAFPSKMKGVQVVEDVMLDFSPPQAADELDADVAAEPVAGDAAVGANETFRAVQWAPDAISAPAAWEAGYQGAGARVAILDGGIRNTHLDIAPNLDVARSASFVPGQLYNFDAARDAAGVCGGRADTFWHGTHVAGIVAAPANNIGTVGIAPKATIIGVKVLHCGSGSFAWIMNGVYYAATPISEGGAGANIINMSLGAGINKGGPGIAHLLNALSRATNYAKKRGVLVIAAAGNSGLDIGGNLVFVPAMSVDVVAISATAPEGWALGSTDLDTPTAYTNFGKVAFAAPGGDSRLFIPFTPPATNPNAVCSKPRFPAGTVTQYCWVLDLVMAPCRGSGTSNGTYCWASGTSMAAPAAAGVAALVVGKYPGISPSQLEAILRASSDDLGKPGNDPYYGGGRVNAWKAVQQ